MTALFRCDADWNIGLGHVARSLALAEALRERGLKSLFLGNFGVRAATMLASARMESRKFCDEVGSITDSSVTFRTAHDVGAKLVILDGYRFDAEYISRIRNAGWKLLVLDDFAAWTEYSAEFVLNFTVGARRKVYRTDGQLLLGPRYFLAREQLRRLRLMQPFQAEPRYHTCIALSGDRGGSRTLLATQTLLQARVPLRVILPPDTAMQPALERLLASTPHKSELRIGPDNLGEDLAWADIVVCTGGMIKYEANYLGRFVVTAANNQGEASDTQIWTELGIGYDLGLIETLTGEDIMKATDYIMGRSPLALRDLRYRAQEMFGPDPTSAVVALVSTDL